MTAIARSCCIYTLMLQAFHAFQFSSPISRPVFVARSVTASIETAMEPDIRFDLTTSTLLAAYAFDAYNEPRTGKEVAMGLDATRMTFTSTEFIKIAFQGVALVTIGKLSLNDKAIGEEGILESMFSGADPDPYIVVSVVEQSLKGVDGGRIIDSSRTEFKKNNRNPVYNETFLLYVTDPDNDIISVDVYDKDFFMKDDDLIGKGSPISIHSFVNEEGGSGGTVLDVPIPIFSERASPQDLQQSLSDAKRGVKRVRVGRLEARLQFIPWTRNATAQKSTKDPEKQDKPVGLPRGSLYSNWPRLIETVLAVRTRLQPKDTFALATGRLPGLKLSKNMHQVSHVVYPSVILVFLHFLIGTMPRNAQIA